MKPPTLATLLILTSLARAEIWLEVAPSVQQQTVQQASQHAESIKNAVDQLKTANDALVTARQQLATFVQIAGDPTKAVSLIGGEFFQGTEAGTTLSALADLSSTIGSTAGNGLALSQTVQNLYQTPPAFNVDTVKQFNRGTDPFQKYQVVDRAFQNFSNEMTASQSQSARLRTKLKEVMAQQPANEAEQRQKQTDVAAINTQLDDLAKRTNEAGLQLQNQYFLNQSKRDEDDDAKMERWIESQPYH